MFAFIDVSGPLEYVVRGAAAVVGLLIGWFVTGPIANVLSRLAFQRPVAAGLLPWIRGLGAIGLAVLLYLIVPVGGYGPGPGGGPGKGKDKGTDKGPGPGKDEDTDKGSGKDGGKHKTIETPPDLLRVEILGGARYKFDQRWYLFQGERYTKDELKVGIKKHLEKEKLEKASLQPVKTDDTVDAPDAILRHTQALNNIAEELGLVALALKDESRK